VPTISSIASILGEVAGDSVGYDNERGKGDHRHVRGREFVYRFKSPDQLVADFLADVEEARRRR
jgi:hypothetical protein